MTAFAQAAPPPGPGLKIDPPSFRLWKDRVARVTVEGAGPQDEVRFTTSLGRFEPPVRSGDGRVSALWHPPDEGFPQISIVCAHVRSGSTWRTFTATLPLWGLGDAVVSATAQTKITVRIGAREYGPVVTDDAGVARVPVEVGPGERFALHGTREIPLNVPDGKRVHASTPRDFAWAGEASKVPVTLVAVAPDGAPPKEASWDLRVDRGAITAPVSRAPGVWEAEWTVPAGDVGIARLTARLGAAAAGAQTATLELLVRAGPGSRIALSATPETITAGTPWLKVRARVLDATGHPVRSPIAFEAPRCRSSTFKDLGDDGYELLCAVPSTFGGARSLEVTAQTPAAQGALHATLAVPLHSGPAHEVAFEGSPGVVPANGTSATTLRVRAVDAFGNVLSADILPAVQVTPDAVAEVRVETDPDSGEHFAVVQPRDLDGTIDASLALRYGTVEGRTALSLVGHRTLLSIAPRLGVVSNLRDVTAPEVAVEALTLRRLGPGHLVAGADVGVFAFGLPRNALGATGSTRFVPLLAEIGYRAPIWRLALTGFAEGGASRVNDELRIPGAPALRSSGWTATAGAGVKVELGLWRGAAIFNVRAVYAADPALPTVSGALLGVGAAVGYRLEVF